eukprot:jgi/Chlat1/2308/Chrsp17S02602
MHPGGVAAVLECLLDSVEPVRLSQSRFGTHSMRFVIVNVNMVTMKTSVVDDSLCCMSLFNADAYERVARLIATVPKRTASAREYYARVGPQLHALFRHSRKRVVRTAAADSGAVAMPQGGGDIRYAAMLAAASVLQQDRREGAQHIIAPIVEPLQRPEANSSAVSSQQLVEALSDLQGLMTTALDRDSVVATAAEAYPLVVPLHAFLQGLPSRASEGTQLAALQAATADVIAALFAAPADIALPIILLSLAPGMNNICHPAFRLTGMGEVAVSWALQTAPDFDEHVALVVTELLAASENWPLASALLLHLLQQFTALQTEQTGLTLALLAALSGHMGAQALATDPLNALTALAALLENGFAPTRCRDVGHLADAAASDGAG